MPIESSSYVMKMRGVWHVVVPIRGKLSAKLCDATFPTKPMAEEWMRGVDGRQAIDALRNPFGLPVKAA